MSTSIETSRLKEIKQPKPLPSPTSDFYELAETLPAEELAVLKQVRAFMEKNVAPILTKYWVEDAFPFEIIPAINKYAATMHFVGQSTILSLTAEKGTGKAYCLAHHLTIEGAKRKLMIAALRYYDTFVKDRRRMVVCGTPALC